MCVVRLFRASQPKGQIDNDGDFLMHKSIPTAPSICPPIFISFAGAWLFKHPCPQEFVIWEEKLQAVPPGGGGVWEEMTDAPWSNNSLSVLLNVLFLISITKCSIDYEFNV